MGGLSGYQAVERLGAWLLATNLWVAAGLTLGLVASGHVLDVHVSYRTMLLAFASTLFVYNLDHLRDSATATLGGRRASSKLIGLITVASGIATVMLLAYSSLRVQLACAAYAGLGVLYGSTLHGFQLKRVPGLKSWLVALGSAIAGVGLTVADTDRNLGPDVIQLALVAFACIAVNAHLCDIVDVKDDQSRSISTLPVLLGVARTRFLLRTVLIAAGIAELVGWSTHVFSFHPEIAILLAINFMLSSYVTPELPTVWGYLLIDGTLFLVPLGPVLHRILV